MTDFGNTVGDDFDRDSTPDKYIERKEAMTPLEAAQAIIDARARATAGRWYFAPYGINADYRDGEVRVADTQPPNIGSDFSERDGIFTALTANHAAAVAQAYIDAMQDNARLRAALEVVIADWNYVTVKGAACEGCPDPEYVKACRAALEESR
jgi:hypothetical protein